MKTSSTENLDCLTDAPQLLAALFPHESSRPCLRTLRQWQKQRVVPFVKVGRMVLFNPLKVKAALEGKFTIEPK
jgi:hypothetical protein